MATIVKRRGAYYLDFRDALGVRVQKRYRTKQAADDAFKLLVPLSGQRRHPTAASIDPRITVGAWVRHWLAQSAPPVLKPRAWDAHERACTRFIIPALGEVRLTKLRRAEVRAFLLDVQRHGRAACRRRACVATPAVCTHGGPLAPGSVRHVYSALRAALQAAVDDELLSANPAAKLGGKRGLRCEPTKRERLQRIEQRVLTADELTALTRTTRRTARAWYPLVLTYARAGLRLGEAIALEVGDFHATPPVLRVRQAFDQRRMTLETPKHGPRDVDLTLSPELVAVLRAQVAGLKKHALKTGQPLARWLFPSRAGTALQARNVERAIARLGRIAGLARPVSPHDLRHTYGTLLIESGVSPVYVQRQFGHASIQLTVDTYGATARPKLPPSAVGLLDTGRATQVVTFGASGDIAGATRKA